ncbi:Putative nitric oxide synthase [Monoraphidium neglectum]|uniref:Putative nitric oxide synthase n=1 Tax=Monoraphidium neglectum TaxID=145388 RepID=A0A0D2J5W5_9CHLO|nr:Putative nitric oxide synthase [Monoraphidium neglectum]KIY95277.1 Putative nitric oxide synthase [Monoraphidium neglectum]|eukprot:XP_013894297.1 Putative nitric oxide synthase [Monoraphidium neglectum]
MYRLGRPLGARKLDKPPPPAPQPPVQQAQVGQGQQLTVSATRTSQVAKKGACYGCGAPLQTDIASGPGYVRPDKYDLKARHKQLNQVLCERCAGLCNGAMIPAVEDFTQKKQLLEESRKLQELFERQQQQLQQEAEARQRSGGAEAREGGQEQEGEGEPRQQLLGKLLVSPEELREKLLEVRSRKAVVVLLVDLLDASGTLMSKVRDMVGSNPIVLVGTKMDLLPEGSSPKEECAARVKGLRPFAIRPPGGSAARVVQWLTDASAAKRLTVTSTHLVSSHSGDGVEAATAKICRERKGRDVFVVGAANVGKSAFVRAMLREMSRMEGSNFDAAAMANSSWAAALVAAFPPAPLPRPFP